MLRILQLGCFGDDNLGDEIVAREIRRQVRQRFLDQEISFTMVTRDLERSQAEHPEVASFVTEDEMPKSPDLIPSQDLVIFGGGTLLGWRPIRSARLFVRTPGAQEANLFVYGCGVNVLEPGGSYPELEQFLRLARTITVRSARCAQFLAGIGFKEVEVTADPAYLIPTETYRPQARLAITLCGKAAKFSWLQRRRYLLAVAKAVGSYLELTGQSAEFLPFRIQTRRRIRSDMTWGKALARRVNGLAIAENNRPETILHSLALADLYVGTRLHGCILAATTGCRVLGIGWDEKMHQCFDDLGIKEQLLGLEEASNPNLLLAAMTSAKPADPEKLAELRARAAKTPELLSV